MSPGTGTAYVVFRAGGERFGVAVDRVQGASRARQIVPLPGAPPEYAGVTFVRGEPLGVLNAVRALARRPESAIGKGEAGGGFLLILEGGRHALLVDRIESVEEIQEGESELKIVSIDEVLAGGKW